MRVIIDRIAHARPRHLRPHGHVRPRLRQSRSPLLVGRRRRDRGIGTRDEATIHHLPPQRGSEADFLPRGGF